MRVLKVSQSRSPHAFIKAITAAKGSAEGYCWASSDLCGIDWEAGPSGITIRTGSSAARSARTRVVNPELLDNQRD